jgi:hypothetical protein
MSNPTLDETLQEFDAGIFVDKVTEALKQAALGTVQHGKKGSVSLVFELSQIGDSSSVQVKHTLKYVKPTKNGKVSEENATSTAMFVNKDGYLAISPELQTDLFFNKNENIVTSIHREK